MTGVGRDSMQGDVAFLDVLAQAGAVTRSGPDWLETEGGTLRGIDVDLNAIPDAAMTLGVMALFAQGPTHSRRRQLAGEGNGPHRRHGHGASKARRGGGGTLGRDNGYATHGATTRANRDLR